MIGCTSGSTLPGGGYDHRECKTNAISSVRGFLLKIRSLELWSKLKWLWRFGLQKCPDQVKVVAGTGWFTIKVAFKWLMRCRLVRWSWIFVQGYLIAWVIFHSVAGFLGLPFIPLGNYKHLEKLDYFYEYPIPPLDPNSNVVTVDIYDLWWTWIPFNRLMMKFQGGCWHSEINVYDRVFRYSKEPPKDEAGWVRKDLEYSEMAYRGRITLGATDWTKEEIDRLYVQKNKLRIWQYENHEILMNNCNDISFWVADKIGFGEEWPLWLDAFPKWFHRSYIKWIEGSWLLIEEFTKKPIHPRPFSVFRDWFTNAAVNRLYYHKHPVLFSSPSVNERHEKLTGEEKFPGGKPRSEEKVKKWLDNKNVLANIDSLDEYWESKGYKDRNVQEPTEGGISQLPAIR